MAAGDRPSPRHRRPPPTGHSAHVRTPGSRGCPAARADGAGRLARGRRPDVAARDPGGSTDPVGRPARSNRAGVLRWAHPAANREEDGYSAGDGQEPHPAWPPGDAPRAAWRRRGRRRRANPLGRSMNCDTVRELAPAFVLGALTRSEEQAVREHLATCGEPHPEFEAFGGVVPYFGETVELIEPPASLKERVLAAVAAEPRP